MRNKYPKVLNPDIRSHVKTQLQLIKSALPITEENKDDICSYMTAIHRDLLLGGCEDYSVIVLNGSPIVSYRMRNRSAALGAIACDSDEAYALEGIQ